MPTTRANEGLPRRDQTYDRERVSNRTTSGGPSTRHGLGGGSRKSHVEDDEDRIGPYLIGEEIGRGSFATVFKGERYVRLISPVPATSILHADRQKSHIIGQWCCRSHQVSHSKQTYDETTRKPRIRNLNSEANHSSKHRRIEGLSREFIVDLLHDQRARSSVVTLLAENGYAHLLDYGSLHGGRSRTLHP